MSLIYNGYSTPKHVYWVEGLLGAAHVALKLVLACASLGCIMKYAKFVFVVMGSGPGSSCGGIATLYSAAGIFSES